MKQTRNETLVARRKNYKLFQEQIASAVGISYRHYQNIEAGTCKPNVETAISIAEILESNVHDLFGPHRQFGGNNTQSDSNTDEEAVEARKNPAVAAERLEVPVAAGVG
jgi:DNA-binding XRE family transcriptional regulator